MEHGPGNGTRGKKHLKSFPDMPRVLPGKILVPYNNNQIIILFSFFNTIKKIAKNINAGNTGYR